MGKKKTITMTDIMRAMPKDPNKAITESLNKKGKIKADTKKNTKLLKSFCCHHSYSKKGKLKPRIDMSSGTYRCTLCGEEIAVAPLTNESVAKTMDNIVTIANNAKFLATSINAGPETLRYWGTLQALAETAPKQYNKVKDVVIRQTNDKGKNRKKNKGNRNGSVSGWRL